MARMDPPSVRIAGPGPLPAGRGLPGRRGYPARREATRPGVRLPGQAGAGIRVEREDVVRLDAHSYLLPRSRWLAPFGARHDLCPALGQPDVQQRVGAELLDQEHLAGQLPGAVEACGTVGR